MKYYIIRAFKVPWLQFPLFRLILGNLFVNVIFFTSCLLFVTFSSRQLNSQNMEIPITIDLYKKGMIYDVVH